MAALPNISKIKINEAVKHLLLPVQAHLRRCRKLSAYILERLQTEEWFVALNIRPENLISAVAVHGIGKCTLPKEAYYFAHCSNKKQLEQYYSHCRNGVLLVEETCNVTLAEYKETSYGGVLYRVLSEHHRFDDWYREEDMQGVSFAANFCAVVDLLDNCLFVGESGELELASAVEKLREGINRGLDCRVVSALTDDLEALDQFVHSIYKRENKGRREDREQYGIGLRYVRIMDIASGEVFA